MGNVFRPAQFEEMATQNPLNHIKLEKGEVYDLVFQNYPACNGVCETHPMHLHGHDFWVLGHFKGEWNGSVSQIDALCTEQCPIRDPVFLVADEDRPSRAGCGYTVVRLVADSPGVWPVHCHQ